ncbi:hypothetical protein BDP81DRAFT_123747 [Colletotrichum phormii]|uniref:Secreted protein n=1 Tax=Colletotrichum phormii TaxID=359342 RepID=A0AAI9ZZ30_9PEZI|nr:uncharacterized protein BDP81DRAFT_123747 [Colletotrichum phormii]KAK1640861.1 hypothetical protein BDP81DRAFT_123747 [Colletotrichum phormii]
MQFRQLVLIFKLTVLQQSFSALSQAPASVKIDIRPPEGMARLEGRFLLLQRPTVLPESRLLCLNRRRIWRLQAISVTVFRMTPRKHQSDTSDFLDTLKTSIGTVCLIVCPPYKLMTCYDRRLTCAS